MEELFYVLIVIGIIVFIGVFCYLIYYSIKEEKINSSSLIGGNEAKKTITNNLNSDSDINDCGIDEHEDVNAKKYIDKSINLYTTENFLGSVIRSFIGFAILGFIVVFIFVAVTGMNPNVYIAFLVIPTIVGLCMASRTSSQNNKKANEIHEIYDTKLDKIKTMNFNVDVCMLTADAKGILVDERNDKMVICSTLNSEPILINFKDILSYELIEDGNQEIEGKGLETLATQQFVGDRAAFAVANSSRNVIQYCSTLYVQIKTKDISSSSPKVFLINSNIDKNTQYYRSMYDFGKELIITLEKIIYKNNENVIISNKLENDTTFNELKKLKELFESNLITQEDFDRKKAKILNI